MAEASFDPASSKVDPAKQGSEAFRDLAGFLFGKNSKQAKMSMTMPVLTDSRGAMQFVLPDTVKVRFTACFGTAVCAARTCGECLAAG